MKSSNTLHFFQIITTLLFLSGCSMTHPDALLETAALPDDKGLLIIKAHSGILKFAPKEAFNSTGITNKEPEIKDTFSLSPDYDFAALPLKPGVYVLRCVTLSIDWSGCAGLHKITGKSYYGEFEIGAGEVVYIGTIRAGNDGGWYQTPHQNAQQNGALGALIGGVIQAAVADPFQPQDIAFTLEDEQADAREFLMERYKTADFAGKLKYRPLSLGYWAGKDSGD
jgi:hypothetical protein